MHAWVTVYTAAWAILGKSPEQAMTTRNPNGEWRKANPDHPPSS